jgi:LysM repeat protein
VVNKIRQHFFVNKTLWITINALLMTSNFVNVSYSMKKLIVIISIFLIILHLSGRSQEKVTVEEYINLYTALAIKEMKNYRIPASITLAQGILESENGNSPLALEANNHFGIKCHDEWTGQTFNHDDDVKNECFRKYGKVEDSYRDHSEFLSTRDRYKALFDLEITDYKGWAYGLKQAGYATNPRYPEILIRIIEENGLAELDKAGSRQLAVGGQRSAVSNHNPQHVTRNPDLAALPPDVFEISGRGGNDRIIFLNNGVKFVLAREGDDYYKIAAEFGIYSYQIYKYNDMAWHDNISPGQKVYLLKKKKTAKYDFHVVQPGETLYSIAQDYGIQLKALCRLNGRKECDDVNKGEKLKLN